MERHQLHSDTPGIESTPHAPVTSTVQCSKGISSQHKLTAVGSSREKGVAGAAPACQRVPQGGPLLDNELMRQSSMVLEPLIPTPANINTIHLPGEDLLSFIKVQQWVQSSMGIKLPLLNGMLVLVPSAQLQQPAGSSTPATSVPWRLRQIVAVEAAPGVDPADATVVLVGGLRVRAGVVKHGRLAEAQEHEYLCCELVALQLSGELCQLQVFDVAHMAWRVQVACELEIAMDAYEQGQAKTATAGCETELMQVAGQPSLDEARGVLKRLPPPDFVSAQILPCIDLNPYVLPESPDQPQQPLSTAQHNQLLHRAAAAWTHYMQQKLLGQQPQPVTDFVLWRPLPVFQDTAGSVAAPSASDGLGAFAGSQALQEEEQPLSKGQSEASAPAAPTDKSMPRAVGKQVTLPVPKQPQEEASPDDHTNGNVRRHDMTHGGKQARRAPGAASHCNAPHEVGSAAAAVAAALAAVAAAGADGVATAPLDHNAGGAQPPPVGNTPPMRVQQQRLPPTIVDLDDAWDDQADAVGSAGAGAAAAGVEVHAEEPPVPAASPARACAARAAVGSPSPRKRVPPPIVDLEATLDDVTEAAIGAAAAAGVECAAGAPTPGGSPSRAGAAPAAGGDAGLRKRSRFGANVTFDFQHLGRGMQAAAVGAAGQAMIASPARLAHDSARGKVEAATGSGAAAAEAQQTPAHQGQQQHSGVKTNLPAGGERPCGTDASTQASPAAAAATDRIQQQAQQHQPRQLQRSDVAVQTNMWLQRLALLLVPADPPPSISTEDLSRLNPVPPVGQRYYGSVDRFFAATPGLLRADPGGCKLSLEPELHRRLHPTGQQPPNAPPSSADTRSGSNGLGQQNQQQEQAVAGVQHPHPVGLPANGVGGNTIMSPGHQYQQQPGAAAGMQQPCLPGYSVGGNTIKTRWDQAAHQYQQQPGAAAGVQQPYLPASGVGGNTIKSPGHQYQQQPVTVAGLPTCLPAVLVATPS